jgi:hypothetical protein
MWCLDGGRKQRKCCRQIIKFGHYDGG